MIKNKLNVDFNNHVKINAIISMVILYNNHKYNGYGSQEYVEKTTIRFCSLSG